MVIDPIGDMLNRVKTAGHTQRPTVTLPYSGIKLKIANILSREGFVGAVAKKTRKGLPTIEINLLYTDKKVAKVKGVTRISKPSRRIYSGHDKLGFYHRNLGLLLLSTPKGLLTQTEARKENIGGEVLFRIW
jgi:small subunit ribosomal protein S8